MEKQAIFSIVLRLISHLLLFIFFVQFYLIEQMGDYMSDRITTTSRFKQVSVSEFPTLTICMDPPQKPSVALMYGYNKLTDIHTKDVPNTTLPQRFEASSYILNRDFHIKDLTAYEDYKGNYLKIGENDNFWIHPIVTYFRGICYKIQPKFKVNDFIWKIFQIHLDESIDGPDAPNKFVVYLTSPNATLNIGNFGAKIQIVN